MKNFFKFNKPKDSYEFQIKEPELPIAPKYDKNENISTDLSKNIEIIKDFFHFPTSNDFKMRNFEIKINGKEYNSIIIFYDGLADSSSINTGIIKPLIKNINFESKSILKTENKENLKNIILGNMLIQSQISLTKDFSELIDSVNHGECALLVESLDIAIVCDVKKIPDRSVDKSQNEMTIKGVSESFVETLRTNTALIRKYVKDENLIFETLEVGKKGKTKCAICYISDITNESIISEVKRRINSVDIDYLIDSGELEQFVEDKTYTLNPLILSTERPDKVASSLIEGRVAIMVEGSPNVLIVPAVFSDFTHSPEDTYIRHPYALLLRFFRVPAVFLSIFLPGLYIAITTFHQEMIPTDLLFSIAGTREKVPFPMLVELLIMETAFEIIREASIRTPAPVGPTLGIVGTLILGQAIVSANIVSPILVIIVALTGISTFAIANFSLNYSFRIARFFYILLGGSFGFFGISLGLFIHLCLLSSTTSFGVPYLTPLSPIRKGFLKDDIFISPLWKQEKRPIFLKPKLMDKEPKISRKWLKGG